MFRIELRLIGVIGSLATESSMSSRLGERECNWSRERTRKTEKEREVIKMG